MDWALIAFVAFIGLGLFAGAAIVARNPTFWVGIAIAAWKRLWPVIAAQIAEDMANPEVDAKTKANAKIPGGPPTTGVSTGKTITKTIPKRDS